MEKVLIIEDDKDISELISIHISDMDFEVDKAFDGKTGLMKALNNTYKFILLDIRLPYLDGFEICKKIRQEKINTPVLMLTSKSEEIDKVLGLEIGADDYITKPFSMEELILRIEAILRRTSQENQANAQAVFTLGKFTFDTRKQLLAEGDNVVKLTTKESDLLKLLCQNANKVLERNYALKSIWIDDNYFNARSMDVYITKLRKHLKDEPTVEIINVHGKGYKLIV